MREEVLRKLNNTLSALGNSSQAMAQAQDEGEYLKKVCQIVVEDTEFAMVWIGYAEEDKAKTIRPVASAGFNDNYLETIRLSWADNEYGRGPTGVAIRTGKMGICNNILTDPAFKPWREQAIKRGYASSIVFPLKSGDSTFGAITIYSKESESFLDDEIKMLSKLASDLAHGITTIRLRVANQLAERELIKSHEELDVLVKKRTTELLSANETLKLTEDKYRTVADFATNWEFWLSPTNHMIYCSPSCERITGYTATEFVVNSQLILDIIHPEDLHIYLEHKEIELRGNVCAHEIQYRICRKDGLIRWIDHYCQPVYDESKNFRGIRGSNKDITARKKMEELLKTSNRKYSLLSANISDGIFIYKNGSFDYVNSAMSHIFGYPENELTGMNLKQLVRTDYLNELELIDHSRANISQIRNVELECIRKDDSSVFVEFLFNYVAKEKVIYGVVHDITDKKQIQKNIVKAIIQTEEKERSYFSKELHDGVGPLLSAIKLYLQWSERAKNEKSRQEIILKAEEILEETLVTVKEISNKLSPHLLTNYGLVSAIQSFINKLEESSSIHFTFEHKVNERLDSEIEAALYRAVIECINNTIKYAGAKNITVNLNELDGQLLLQYRDDGIGFDVNETIAIKKGLGLFNLQNRIQNIGGNITLQSQPGEGVNYKIVVNL
jgi:PAS domain S-box-containing protein